MTLREGQYFTAKCNGEKIRGIVSIYTNKFELYNSSVGEKGDCPDDADGFSHKLRVNKYDENFRNVTTAKALQLAGITELKIVTDKRAKAVIDRDEAPNILDYYVYKKGNKVIFGCGAVEYTVDQIKTFIKIREMLLALPTKEIKLYDEMVQVAESESGKSIDKINLGTLKKIIGYESSI